jgi:hypothetical protein
VTGVNNVNVKLSASFKETELLRAQQIERQRQEREAKPAPEEGMKNSVSTLPVFSSGMAVRAVPPRTI